MKVGRLHCSSPPGLGCKGNWRNWEDVGHSYSRVELLLPVSRAHFKFPPGPLQIIQGLPVSCTHSNPPSGLLQNYIARFGHGSAKLARQAQSKEKTLQKMMTSGLTERVVSDKTLSFYFPPCGKIPPPVIMVQNASFKYTKDGPCIYNNLEFGIDLDTRVALVGPNGAGKSTLLKLLTGEVWC